MNIKKITTNKNSVHRSYLCKNTGIGQKASFQIKELFKLLNSRRPSTDILQIQNDKLQNKLNN